MESSCKWIVKEEHRTGQHSSALSHNPSPNATSDTAALDRISQVPKASGPRVLSKRSLFLRFQGWRIRTPWAGVTLMGGHAPFIITALMQALAPYQMRNNLLLHLSSLWSGRGGTFHCGLGSEVWKAEEYLPEVMSLIRRENGLRIPEPETSFTYTILRVDELRSNSSSIASTVQSSRVIILLWHKCLPFREWASSPHRKSPMLIKSLVKSCPPQEMRSTEWDVSLVFRSLTRHPYEPVKKVSDRDLFLKSLFLLAFASARRVDELHNISAQIHHLEGWDFPFLLCQTLWLRPKIPLFQMTYSTYFQYVSFGTS